MSVLSPDQENRRVVPRWRDSTAAVKAGELAPVPVRDPERIAAGAEEEVEKHANDWRRFQSVGHAADLVSSAIVLERPRSAEAAAEYLVRNRADAGELAYRLARGLLSPQWNPKTPSIADVSVVGESAAVLAIRKTVTARVRDLRTRLHSDPRDAIAWHDLSREYARVGLMEQSLHAMRAAVSLAPNHRLVLRSAARLFLHNREPDLAHAILRRSPATTNDPWLLAAEVSVATVAGRTSSLIKPARALISTGNFSPFQITELAGSLGTLEASHGKRKAARRFFDLALEDPTENTVAQAHWTARHTGLIEFEERHLRVPRSFEARAFASFAGERWQASVESAQNWFDDEPFATRPAELGASVAGVALDDGATAVRFATLAAFANPTSHRTKSALVFALTLAGRFAEAIDVYTQIDSDQLTDEERVVWLANGGMLAYRTGDFVLGQVGYEGAVKAAEALRNTQLKAGALGYWAGEALRAQRLVQASARSDLAVLHETDFLKNAQVANLVRQAWDAINAVKGPGQELTRVHLSKGEAVITGATG